MASLFYDTSLPPWSLPYLSHAQALVQVCIEFDRSDRLSSASSSAYRESSFPVTKVVEKDCSWLFQPSLHA